MTTTPQGYGYYAPTLETPAGTGAPVTGGPVGGTPGPRRRPAVAPVTLSGVAWRAVVAVFATVVGVCGAMVAAFATMVTWSGCLLSCRPGNPPLGAALGVLTVLLLAVGLDVLGVTSLDVLAAAALELAGPERAARVVAGGGWHRRPRACGGGPVRPVLTDCAA